MFNFKIFSPKNKEEKVREIIEKELESGKWLLCTNYLTPLQCLMQF
jgi:hypothetical protein